MDIVVAMRALLELIDVPMADRENPGADFASIVEFSHAVNDWTDRGGFMPDILSVEDATRAVRIAASIAEIFPLT